MTISTPVLLATTPGNSYGYAVIPDRYLLIVGQGQMTRVKLPIGVMTNASPYN